jgi:long-chain acyl-CoA synthetase
MNRQSTSFDPVQTSAEETALIIYTSGTTGQPKGAELTHNNLVHNAILSVEILQLNKTDKLLIVLPLFHIFGMTVLMNAGIYQGATLVLVSRFDAEVAYDHLQKHGITVFAGVPTMYWSLLQYTDSKFDYEIDRPKFKDLCIRRSITTCKSDGRF